MDGRHVDSLTRALADPGSRRRLLAILAALPLLGSLFGLLELEDTEAKDRRRRRRARHRLRHNPGERKGKRKGKHKKPCMPDSAALTCAGRCGQVIDNCQRSIDCGPCICEPACQVCLTCDASTRSCVPDAAQVGQACGSPGLVCTSEGTCARGTVACDAADGEKASNCIDGEICCSRVCQTLTTLEAECPVGPKGFLTYPDGTMRCAAENTAACGCLGVYRDCAAGTACTMHQGAVICDWT